MSIGRTNAGGGGGGGLNFKVVKNPQPTSPKENTIWVNTDVDIPSWAFSATEPENPEAGMVWFITGVSATVAFNAIKKNDIQVYPNGAKQYVDGAWASNEAWLYKGGTWVQFSNGGYLYYQGDLCIYNGGNWLTAGVGMNADAPSPQAPGFSNGTTSATITQAATKGGIVYKANKIDLTDATHLVFTGNSSVSSEGHKMAIAVWSTLPIPGQYWAKNRLAKADFGNMQGAVSTSLDVSALSGEYYVGICIYGIRSLEMDTMQLVV